MYKKFPYILDSIRSAVKKKKKRNERISQKYKLDCIRAAFGIPSQPIK